MSGGNVRSLLRSEQFQRVQTLNPESPERPRTIRYPTEKTEGPPRRSRDREESQQRPRRIYPQSSPSNRRQAFGKGGRNSSRRTTGQLHPDPRLGRSTGEASIASRTCG